MVPRDRSSNDHASSRMTYRYQFQQSLTSAMVVLLFYCSGVHGGAFKTANACYGNVNNYLRLDCQEGEVIDVLRMVHGAKVKQSACLSPANFDTYRRDCCQPEPTDCTIVVQDSAGILCENRTNCDALATWSTTNKECDQDDYPPATNYMLMEYKCVNPHSNSPPVGDKELKLNEVTSSPASVIAQFNTTTTSPPPPQPSATKKPDTTPRPSTKEPVSLVLKQDKTALDDELSDAMIGAIVAGCVGMVLTFVAFIFYWGRKRRRLRIVGKPQPSVWDYLLSTTFTVRGARGYDHFSSSRSSASSEGGASPVVRKNIWLPNIVHQADDNHVDEVISNYDNDKYCRVEIHHDANPSPYAILNLDSNQANLARHQYV